MEFTLILITSLLAISCSVWIYNIATKRKGTYHSHWTKSIPSFSYASTEFYTQLKDVVTQDNKERIRAKVVTEKQGNLFSNSRKYLNVQWKEYNYFVCLAPFRNSTLVSSWLFYKQRKREIIVSLIPVIGEWLLSKIFPTTMYRIDTASMFMGYCHDEVMHIIDEITKDTGFRLSESDRKLQFKSPFKR